MGKQFRKSEFQTPTKLCEYMASLVPDWANTVLEPTPGDGNLVHELSKRFKVRAPADFFKMRRSTFDYAVLTHHFPLNTLMECRMK